MKTKKMFVLAMVVIVLAASPAPAEVRYNIIDLGTLGGDSSCAYSINNSGQIVGWADTTFGNRHATLFDPNGGGNNIDLGTLGGDWSEARSINNNGEVVGWSETDNGLVDAFSWTETGGIGGTLLTSDCVGHTDSEAYSTNDNGWIAGRSGIIEREAGQFDPNSYKFSESCAAVGHPVPSPWGESWTWGCLGTLGGTHGCAYAVNNFGQIVGWSETDTGTVEAFLWTEAEGMMDAHLTSICEGHTDSEAYGINDCNLDGRVIVGRSGIIDRSGGQSDASSYNFSESCPVGAFTEVLPFPWLDPITTSFCLGSLGGTEGCAYAVNGAGEIVGYSTTAGGEKHAFIWTEADGMLDLNELLWRGSGWELRAAYCINDNGWIVGYGLNPAGYDHAFLLVPEPVLRVEIDIKPGSWPNAINLGSFGLIPVAILSSADFDATTVDPDTVELAGASIAVRGKSNKFMAHEEDVDGDGLVDLVVQVATANLDPSSLQDGWAVLTAETYDGQNIEGEDEITIVPPEQ